MLKPVLISALAVSIAANVAMAAPRHPGRAPRMDLASMDLAPRKDVARAIPTREFVPDRTPTSFTYALPAPGLGAAVGYRSSADPHPVQTYEVNQVTALGFSRPSSSVGASVGYRF